MAVVKAKVTGTWNGRETWGSGRSRTVEYYVETDDIDDGPSQIALHFAGSGTLPYLGTPYAHGNDVDSTLFLQSFTPNRVPESSPDNESDGKPRVAWRVTCEYTELSESEVGEDENGDPKENPLDWRDRLEIGMAERHVDAWYGYFLGVAHGIDDAGRLAMGRNIAGRPNKPISATTRTNVCASNGQPFDPPPTMPLTDLVIRYTTNFADYDSSWPVFVNGVNNKGVSLKSTFYGVDLDFDTYTLRVADIGSSFRFVNGVRFHEVTFEYQWRKEKWSEMILDQGNMLAGFDGMADGEGGTIVIDSANPGAQPTVIKLKEAPGTNKTDRGAVPGPVMLDGAGQVVTLPDRSKGYWLEYLFYPPSNLENLPGLTVTV